MATIVTLMGKLERQGDSSSSNNWKWQGSWAFGTQDPAPPPVEPPAPHTTPASLPFAYTFERVVDPNMTPIPSLQPMQEVTSAPLATTPTQADEHQRHDDEEHQRGGEENDESPPAAVSNDTLKSKEQSLTEEKLDNMEIDTPDTKKEEETKKSRKDETTRAETTSTGGAPPDSSQPTTTFADAKNKEDSKVDSMTKKETKDVETKDVNQKEPAGTTNNSNPSAKELATMPSKDTKPAVAISSEQKEATTSGDKMVSSTQQPEKPKGPTFGDDGFVDASTAHASCPVSGRWKGSFVAAIGRKGQQRSDIPEHFDLFLYVEPPPDAQLQFVEPREPLKPNHVYVRGAGENQFGVFELVGSFSLTTQVLRVQRLYVRIPLEPPRRRGRKSRHATDASNAGRSTRKRQLSWKRKAALVDETSTITTRTPTGSVGGGGGGGGGSGVGGGGGGGGGASTASDEARPAKRHKRKRALDENASTATATTAGTAASNVGASGGIPRTVDTSAPAQSKSAPSRLAAPAPHGSTVVRLPVEGDVQQARWRAAHYYHYNPAPKDAASSSSNAPSNNAASTTKSVVYEGELYGGVRDGRGVCVYNNGMVYEGEWRRDKEHGYGTLWTGDKKHIIYQGEWERGRMHGQGKYYYYDDIGSEHNKIQTRYEGEFRENLRHGTGMYVLPDGSSYSGQWQNGSMNGRGVFTWPDGSVYDGDWKDNKRHGNGVLKASDGFYYEGAWVHNTMEGRGSATYPDGQEYHGMFISGRREGRGTIKFPNGAVYEGRFRDDAVDGQGTMKIRKAVLIPRDKNGDQEDEDDTVGVDQDGDQKEGGNEAKSSDNAAAAEEPKKVDYMIPISFQSDMGHIHRRAGFTLGGI